MWNFCLPRFLGPCWLVAGALGLQGCLPLSWCLCPSAVPSVPPLLLPWVLRLLWWLVGGPWLLPGLTIGLAGCQAPGCGLPASL